MRSRNRRSTSRIRIALSLVAAGVIGSVLLSPEADLSATQQSNFRGGTPSILEDEEMMPNMLRLRFPAGSRSNWHTHTDGQLLMIEEGRGLTQERGGEVREMHPHEPWYTPEGVEHWHGAHPDEAAVQWTIYRGDVEWLDPVTDEQYHEPMDR